MVEDGPAEDLENRGRAFRELMLTTAGRHKPPGLSPLQVAATLSILFAGLVGLVVSSWNVTTSAHKTVSVQIDQDPSKSALETPLGENGPQPGSQSPLSDPEPRIMSVQPLSAAADPEPAALMPVDGTPADIETEFHISGGHWHHGELTLDQFLFTRPVCGASQYRMPLDGLYLCGAGTHPGGGVSGAAGRNAARAILDREKAA